MGDINIDITFGEDAKDPYMISPFGWHTDDDGIVRDESGDPAPTFNRNEPLHIDDVGGVVKNESGNPVLLRDNFCDISDYVSQNHVDNE